jgi:hypothetical protein
MAAMKAGRLLRAASAVSAALGRPSLLASPRLPGSWAAISAAAAEAPQGAVLQSSDMFAFLGTFGLPTAVVVAATTGFFVIGQQLGEMRAKVAASSKSISDAKSDAAVVAKANQDAASAAIAASKEAASAAIAATEAKLAANKEAANAAIAGANAAIAASKEAASAAIAATEAKLAANKEAAASAIAATEAKLAANKEAAASAIAANKEVANAAIAATEAKLAAAEKVIAVMMAGVSVAAELATLKALKGEPKRESP